MLACMISPLCRAQSPGLATAPETALDTHAQVISSSIEPQRSVISLASARRPEGQILARNRGDATFEHVPANYHVFAAATVGNDAGVEVLTLNFAGATRLTRIESKNKDFVVEPAGTCHEGNSYAHGDSCSLLVRFNPQGPGHRLGFLSITHSAEPQPMNFGLTGNGYAPVVSFTPSQISTVASTVSSGTGIIKSATNMAIDGGDILYIADIGNSKIKEIDSSGVINSINPAFATPAAVTADSAGILYSTNVSGSTYYFSDFTPWGVQTAFGYAYVSTLCTVSTPCAFSTVGMSSPANISIDNYDNLFMLEGTTGSAEMPVKSLGQGTGTLTLWHLKNQYAYASGGPGPFAVDAYGDLYTNYTYTPNSTCVIYEEPLYDAEYSPSATRVAGGLKCGFSGDGGLGRGAEISTKIGQMAFDIAGNFYFADAGNQRVRRVDAITGIISTIAGNGTAGYSGDAGAATAATLSNPTGVAVDSQGQVYILSNAPMAGPTQVLRKVGAIGFWNFGSQKNATSSSAKVFTVANTGNETLTLSSAVTITGTNHADFTFDSTTTSCVLTAGATLTPGHSCKIGIVFKPAATGARTASVVLHDNSISGTNTILLNGTGSATVVVQITSPANGSTFASGTAVKVSASVTSASGPKPTGTVQFLVDNVNHGSPIALSSAGTASISLTGLTVATHKLSAKYSGDANHSAAGPTSVSATVSAAVKSTLSLSSASAAGACSNPQFTVRVSGPSGPIPTGEVKLLDRGSLLSSGPLKNGEALLKPQPLGAGMHELTASYAGDAFHSAGVSGSLREGCAAAPHLLAQALPSRK
jgi:hypothetical protein